MAYHRRFSNPLALAVLTLLYEAPMHPYQMAATLKERAKEESIKLRFGSLYSVIERLEREGLIVAGETVREGRRPERTVYHITDAGKVEMHDWLRELVSTPVKEYPQFEAALSLLPGLPPDEAVEMLEVRLEHLDQTIEAINSQIENAAEHGLHPLFLIEADYRSKTLQAERDYVRNLVRRIVDERWGDTEVLQGVPTWRRMHEIRNDGNGIS